MSLMNPEIQQKNDTNTADSETGPFGAVDIVAAFTALRHDLKLQMRGGAETLESLIRRLDRLELTIQDVAKPPADSDRQSRSFALALAEIENAVQRTVDGLRLFARKTNRKPTVTQIVQENWRSASWLTRWVASHYHRQLISAIENSEREQSEIDQRDSLPLQSIELLLARVHRLMKQLSMRRHDVTGLPFDSEFMNAIEAVDSVGVPPGHVAQQHKPAYFWNNTILNFAEVDVAKSH